MNILKKFWHSIATRFIPQMLCVSLKKTNRSLGQDIIGKFEKIILRFKKMKILRVLGFKDFLKYNEIIEMLMEEDSTQTFSKVQSYVFIKNEFDRLWMIGSDTHIFFVFDNGYRIDVLEKRPKYRDNLESLFTVEEGEEYAKIIFKDTKTEIPYNLSYTGGTENVIVVFKKFNNE